jgi:hypothetical protein
VQVLHKGGVMTALYGTFVRLQTMADGGVRLVLDLGCSLADIAALNLMPGAAFGLARITGESTIATIKAVEKPQEKVGPLCLLACQYCESSLFRSWLSTFVYMTFNSAEAKIWLITTCGIESRKELDTCADAEFDFHEYVRKPYMAWIENDC